MTDPFGNSNTEIVEILVSAVEISGAPQSVPEGTEIHLSSTVAGVPVEPTPTFLWSVTKDEASFPTGTATNAANFTFTPDDNGTYVVSLSLSDGGLSLGTDSVTILVTNVAPDSVVTAASIDELVFAVGVFQPFSGSFADVGKLDTHTATWNFSRIVGTTTDPKTRTGSVTQGAGNGSVSDSFSFASPGVYSVTLTIADDDTGETISDVRTFVVFDPSEGFVTGGGWIESPPGAYFPDPALTGKANFGFVSKFKKGATTPTGQTEFQFKTAGLNFHSSSYDWLVVAGARAQFKGIGTINGAGSFNFMLTVIDGQVPGGGGVDKFRMKIWETDETSNADIIVYDSGVDDSGVALEDDETPPTSLGGGKIIIHQNGKALHATSSLPGGASSEFLASGTLEPVVDRAISLFAAAGVDSRSLTGLTQVDVQIADLSGSLLGMSSEVGIIWIDRDAAGFGWSTDPISAGGRGGIDLLSAVTHEFGHVLGLGHDILGETLQPGIRQLAASSFVTHHHLSGHADVEADAPHHLGRGLFDRSLSTGLFATTETSLAGTDEEQPLKASRIRAIDDGFAKDFSLSLGGNTQRSFIRTEEDDREDGDGHLDRADLYDLFAEFQDNLADDLLGSLR